MAHVIGIDLGTTYSVVACINADGDPEVVPNEEGNLLTPSVIWFDGATPVAGEAAKEQSRAGTEVVAFFKRSMGDPSYEVSFAGQAYDATALAALMLAHLKQQAERSLGGPVGQAVVTVPAYFAHAQRAATLEAARRAGLLGMVVESEDRSRYVISTLIRKNQPIPAEEGRPYQFRLRREGDNVSPT